MANVVMSSRRTESNMPVGDNEDLFTIAEDSVVTEKVSNVKHRQLRVSSKCACRSLTVCLLDGKLQKRGEDWLTISHLVENQSPNEQS